MVERTDCCQEDEVPQTRPATRRTTGSYVRFALGALPFVGILVLVPFANRDTPMILGMPFLLVWMVAWVILTSVCMTIVYLIDPQNRGDEADSQ